MIFNITTINALHRLISIHYDSKSNERVNFAFLELAKLIFVAFELGLLFSVYVLVLLQNSKIIHN